LTLAAQVNQLHNEIETERRKRINAMVPALKTLRTKDIADELERAKSEADVDITDIIRGGGPSSQMMRSVLDFQYATLKNLTLPGHQKMLLWFTLQEPAYFLAGKDAYARRGGSNSGKPPYKTSSGKISSKQIGDELFNGTKTDSSSEKLKRKGDKENQDKFQSSSPATDAERTWPLFCYELQFSVDQEEKFLVAHKRVWGENVVAETRSQMDVAVNTAESLSKAVGSLSHVLARREERAYLGILNPQQVAAYHTWLINNRGRCRRAVEVDHCGAPLVDASSAARISSVNKDTSLQDVCRRLNEVLQISTTEVDRSMASGE
jgi:hypothetical protein